MDEAEPIGLCFRDKVFSEQSLSPALESKGCDWAAWTYNVLLVMILKPHSATISDGHHSPTQNTPSATGFLVSL